MLDIIDIGGLRTGEPGAIARIGAEIGQAYRDTGATVAPVGGNRLASKNLWDPYQPDGTRGGVTQRACESPGDPCTDIFLGDYFGLQVSAKRVYVLSSSTYYPSQVRGDDGRRLRYQQQVLTTVSRRARGPWPTRTTLPARDRPRPGLEYPPGAP